MVELCSAQGNGDEQDNGTQSFTSAHSQVGGLHIYGTVVPPTVPVLSTLLMQQSTPVMANLVKLSVLTNSPL